MPKAMYKVNDFSGGLNTLKDPADIVDNELQELRNLRVSTQGSIRPAYKHTLADNKVGNMATQFTLSNATWASGDATVTLGSATKKLAVGLTVSSSAAGIPSGATIASITSTTSFELSANATTTQSSAQDITLDVGIDSLEENYGLGYFETDWSGEGTLFEFTGTNVGDASDLSSADGFYNLQEDGSGRDIAEVNNRLRYYVSGTIQDLGAYFDIGDRILISGSAARSFNDGQLKASSQGVYTVVSTANSGKELILDRGLINRSDSAQHKTYNLSITGFTLGEKLTLLADPETHKIHVFTNKGTNWLLNQITLRSSATTVKSKVKYYKADEAIRACDTATTSDCKIQWYGFIPRRHFSNISNTPASFDNSNTYLGYYAKDNTLAPPTEDDLTSASTASPANFTTYPATAGTGFEFNIITHTDVDGAIPAATYELASTFIYDGKQESLPYKYSTLHTIADDNDLCALSLNVSATGPYDPRISGGRIYIRERGTDSEWVMLLDIDLAKGCRTKWADDYTSWFDAGSDNFNCPTSTATANFEVTEFGLLTYEVINGYSSTVFSNALGDQGELWKDSVVSNNRVFVCNLVMKDENTGASKSEASLNEYPDRIMYSMPNRYDTFPSTNFIEAAKGDAEQYVAIEAYADRLLAFKEKSLDIINIASPDDASWFLEDSKKYMGVLNPECVKRTQYGILFMNEGGLYLYNGNNIVNIKENKISDTDWINISSSNSAILYDELESIAYIIKQTDGALAAGYTVELKNGTFMYHYNFVDVSNDGLTNSVDTSTNTMIAHDEGSYIDFFEFERDEVANTAILETKDFDFGDVSKRKKIYSVHITYKSDDALTGYFTLETPEGDSHALSGTVAASATNWATVKLTPSSPITINSKASLRLNTSTAERKIYINDISIEYRMLKKASGG